MMNFHFEDDAEWTHVCEIQLVHAELYSVRKNMGAHRSYNEFRAALELCEKVEVDPEEGSDADILDALVWAPGRRKASVSETPTAAASSHAQSALFSKWESNHSQLMTVLQAQNKRLQEQNERFQAQNERFQAQNEMFQAQNEIFQAQNERQNDTIAALEIQISSLLCTQNERFELLEKQNGEIRVCEQLLQSSVSF
jgi:DNA anti-recombination protein RmuC